MPSLARHRPALPAESPAGSRRSPGEAPGDPDSRRVAEARSRAERRLARQRGAFRPLGGAVVIAVIAQTVSGSPGVGLHGKALGATAALCLYVLALALSITPRFSRLSLAGQSAIVVAMGAGGVALLALQPKGASELAGASAVWIAVARLPLRFGVAIGAGTTVALDLAAVGAGESSVGVIATTLLCALLGLMAYFNRQARESQDRTEVLLAELEDARAEQTRAAALAERGRIASELHDVLAHALSGAAIQLEGARLLAEREAAGAEMRGAIERAGALVKEGLGDARAAVGALRGERLPGVEQLGELVEGFRRDMGLEVSLAVEGEERRLPDDAALALYRGAQEALTNVARYAPGASTTVLLSYAPARTRLRVEDRERAGGAAAHAPNTLAGLGGGRGLDGMRERAQRAHGDMRAGPTERGWVVEIDVPV